MELLIVVYTGGGTVTQTTNLVIDVRRGRYAEGQMERGVGIEYRFFSLLLASGEVGY